MGDLVHFLVEGLALALVCVLGVAANSVSSWVLLTSRELDLSPTFVRILVALMCYDSVFLFGLLTVFCFPKLLSDSYNTELFPIIVPLMLPVIQIALTGSVYMTMSVSVERYLSLRTALERILDGEASGARRSTAVDAASNRSVTPVPGPRGVGTSRGWWFGRVLRPRGAAYYILPIFVFAVVYNVTRFFELRTVTKFRMANLTLAPSDVMHEDQLVFANDTVAVVSRNTSFRAVESTELRSNRAYVRDYLLLTNLVFMVVIPLLVLITVNTLLFRLLRQAGLQSNRLSSRVRRDRTIAAMLVVIIAVFVVCHSLKLVITFYEMGKALMDDEGNRWPDWTKHLSGLNHLLLAINSATNFIIYCSKDRKFRLALRRKFEELMPQPLRRLLPRAEQTRARASSAACHATPTVIIVDDNGTKKMATANPEFVGDDQRLLTRRKSNNGGEQHSELRHQAQQSDDRPHLSTTTKSCTTTTCPTSTSCPTTSTRPKPTSCPTTSTRPTPTSCPTTSTCPTSTSCTTTTTCPTTSSCSTPTSCTTATSGTASARSSSGRRSSRWARGTRDSVRAQRLLITGDRAAFRWKQNLGETRL